MTTTSEFNGPARSDRDHRTALLAAQEAGQPRQVYRHSARLLDRAARNGVDTTGWAPQATLSVANANCNTSA